MDKQIMIDGVDVSGCGYYDANADKESYFLHDCKKEHAPCWSCASMPSCLYKKYKRKEQECEELDNEAQNLFTEKTNLELEVKDLQQQLNQLKSENKHLNDLLNQALKELEKTRETLTEIKEIAERDKEFCIKCNGDKEIDCIECIEGGRALLAKDILQKISEVKNA